MSLYAEGETDHEFFRPLLFRIVTDLCLSHGLDTVEVQDSFISLPDYRQKYNLREDRIFNGVAQAIDAISFLFIHADGNGDSRNAFQSRVRPAEQRIRFAYPNLGIVGIVPARETEAWALADQSVVAQSLGINSIPHGYRYGNPERLADPKQVLRRLAEHYRERDVRGLLNIIGQRASFEELHRLRSFREFESNLKRELVRLNLIDE
jgi:hypothetical protein